MSNLLEIEKEIREQIERALIAATAVSVPQKTRIATEIAEAAVKELLDRRLIGIPDRPRTSVDTELIAKLGEIHGCRKHDDADDVIRTALKADDHG